MADSRGEPLDVVLFDRDFDGHHLEYGARLKQGLEEVAPRASIDYLTSVVTPSHHDFFDCDLDPLYDAVDEYEAASDGDVTDRAARFIDRKGCDVLHFLHLDDQMAEAKALASRCDPPRVVGSLGGAFFQEASVVDLLNGMVGTSFPTDWSYKYDITYNRLSRAIHRWGAGEAYERVAPERVSNHYPTGKDIEMRRTLRSGAVDHVVAPNELAAEYVADLATDISVGITAAHDPVDLWDGSDDERRSARDDLGLDPDASVLLFFGGLRVEKGIETLLETAATYSGDRFTLALAGPSGSVDEAAIRRVDENRAVNLHTELAFIDNERTKRYFQACDAVVLPYKYGYGRYRPSNVFHKAIATSRPTIVSDLGTMGEMVRAHDLGITITPESSADLHRAMERFARDPTLGVDPDRTVAEDLTYESLARTVYDVYVES